MRNVKKLLKLAAILPIAMLTACGGETTSFYVPKAGSGDPLRLQRLAERIAAGKSSKIEFAEIIRAHRIGPGKGVVLAYREASAGDEDKIRKLTIFLPNGIGAPGAKLHFSKARDLDGPLALLSDLASPGKIQDCTGMASGGQLSFRKVEGNKVVADLAIDFDMVPVHHYDVCAPLRLERSIVFRRKALQELAPWEGRATGPYMMQEWSPRSARETVWKVSNFVVEDAQKSEPRWHETLRERITDGAVPLRDRDFGVLPHRIGSGRGTAFAHRFFSDHKFGSDSTYGLRLTLFLDQPLPEPMTTIQVGQASGSNEAFISDWSSWGGCLAYASGGEIIVREVMETYVSAQVRLTFDWLPISDDYSSKCENDRVFEEQLLFERKAVSELTPWEGRGNLPSAQAEELWPQE